ncbi:hypothetical protein [Luteimonas suaedae]|uniref:hypothetical protein n=1 Tax=Luteimonas suaedae TaxID=2605430 RepID=UPI0011EE5839|nr:hypothetical protein [Luteimonas suaedae]
MHTIRNATLAAALAIGLGLPAASSAQTVGYNVRTGDVWVDNRLGEINDYGRHYRDPFIDEMTTHYGAPRPLVLELLDERRWAPGDVYYACAIAHALGMPCLDVVREYDRNPGQGWGAVAQRLGIKPGSSEFHALKRGTARTYDRWGHPVEIDRPVRVDWSERGPDQRARAGRSGAHPASHTNHKPADRPGQDKGKGKGKNKGKGKDD